MIDDYVTTMELMAAIEAALPMPARMTPEVRASMDREDSAAPMPLECNVIGLHYLGDEGGILCRLDVGGTAAQETFVSITHLRFDIRLPLARRIAAYQKHRVKVLRRQGTRI